MSKTQTNHSRNGDFICEKIYVDFHKTFTSILSAYVIRKRGL